MNNTHTSILKKKKATFIFLIWDTQNKNSYAINLHLNLTHTPFIKKNPSMKWDPWLYKLLNTTPHQVWESLFCHKILHTWLFKDYVSMKANIENDKGIINLWKNIKNVISILEVVTQDSDVMWKVLPTTLCGFVHV